MRNQWTAEIVGRLHLLKISEKTLAEQTGYSVGYISMLLNGKRDTKKAREKIEKVLDEYKERG